LRSEKSPLKSFPPSHGGWKQLETMLMMKRPPLDELTLVAKRTMYLHDDEFEQTIDDEAASNSAGILLISDNDFAERLKDIAKVKNREIDDDVDAMLVETDVIVAIAKDRLASGVNLHEAAT
jgi:hypothetical protein